MKKKLLIILLSALSLTAVAQETIALLEPRVGEGSTPVTAMEKNMVRGELRKAIVNFSGFEAITRADIDQIMKEQNFQRTGKVSDSQIKKLGEMSGADYICVSTLTKSETEFYLEAYLIHLESGRMSNPASQYGELSGDKLANLFPACKALANELLSSHVPTGYIDLGLPSGTLWKMTNEDRTFTFEDAKKRYGSKLPTTAQWKELFQYCTIEWVDPGHWVAYPESGVTVHEGDNPYFLCKGINGNTITLPIEGYSNGFGCFSCGVKELGGFKGYYYAFEGFSKRNFNFVLLTENGYSSYYCPEWFGEDDGDVLYLHIRLVY